MTYDKLLRCAAGMHYGKGEAGKQCLAAEEVLFATRDCQELRQVLPVGFLSPVPLNNDNDWVLHVAKEAETLVEKCNLSHLKLLGETSALLTLLKQIVSTIAEALPRARNHCRNEVYATGEKLRNLHPDERHASEDRALVDFLFYPEEGLIYVQAPKTTRPTLAL